MCLAESTFPCNCGLSGARADAENGRIGGTAKGQVASTNLTLLATISTIPKGA